MNNTEITKPKKLNKYTLLFIIAVGLIIILLCIHCLTRETPLDIISTEYGPLIQYLQEYKAENGKYPDKIDTNFKSKRLPSYKYRTFNNGNDFKICVNDNKNLLHFESARYCTAEGIYGCDVYEWRQQEIINKWKFEEYADCPKD